MLLLLCVALALLCFYIFFKCIDFFENIYRDCGDRQTTADDEGYLNHLFHRK